MLQVSDSESRCLSVSHPDTTFSKRAQDSKHKRVSFQDLQVFGSAENPLVFLLCALQL